MKLSEVHSASYGISKELHAEMDKLKEMNIEVNYLYGS